MKKTMSVLSLIFVFSAMVSCSSSPKTKVDGKGYIKHSNGSFQLRPYKEVVLENGLKIFFIPDDSLPRVSFTLFVKSGSLEEAGNLAGLNALTAYMLEQGTQTRDAMKIADEFGQMASSLDISPGYDGTTIFADTLVTSKEDLLPLFADVVMNPAFKDAELNRVRAQMLASLQKKVDNPSAFANEKMDAFIFGSHPYGRDVQGTPASLRSLRKQNLIRHYLKYYRPNNASLAVVGNFGTMFEEEVKNTFNTWTRRNIKPVKVATPPHSEKLQVRALVKNGLQQTQIRIGELGIARQDEDYLTLRLVNEVLGGSFASRLNQKIRDDLGLTYSIYSSFDVKQQRGSFDISTFTKNETVGKTLEETLKVVQSFVENGATEKELEAAKSQLIGQFPRAIETSDRLAYNLLALDFYEVPVTYLRDFNVNVEKVTLKDLNAVIKKHLKPEQLRVLIYGDSTILPQLKSYSPEVIRL